MSEKAPADAALAYIKFVMSELKVSATALAKMAGISSSTLTRPLNNEHYKFAPSLITLLKIGKASGIDPAPFLSATDFREINLVPYTKNIYDKSWGPGVNRDEDIGIAIMIGASAAGEWRELEITPFEYGVPLELGTGADTFSLFVKGKSADLIAQEGQLLLCISTQSLQKNPKHKHPIAAMFHPFNRNCALVIERRSEDRKLVEISVRFPIWTGNEWHLICPSSDPAFRKPLIRPDLKSDERFIILGQVLWVLAYAHLDDALMQRLLTE